MYTCHTVRLLTSQCRGQEPRAPIPTLVNKTILDSGSDSNSNLPNNGVNSGHGSDSGVRITYLWYMYTCHTVQLLTSQCRGQEARAEGTTGTGGGGCSCRRCRRKGNPSDRREAGKHHLSQADLWTLSLYGKCYENGILLRHAKINLRLQSTSDPFQPITAHLRGQSCPIKSLVIKEYSGLVLI